MLLYLLITNDYVMKLSKFRHLLNDCVHQFTKGKSTEDIVAAIKILDEKKVELKIYLNRRYGPLGTDIRLAGE